MNLLFECEREVHIEVVGPGFDASDLQRGDLTPHEAFDITLSAEGAISQLKVVNRVSQKAYEDSVRLRREKIRKRFESCPSADLAREIRKELHIPTDVDDYLKKIRSPLVECQTYRPISEDLLRHTLNMIVNSKIIHLYRESTGVKFPLNFSTSFVQRGTRQVFWDIVSPDLKFEGLTGTHSTEL